jgi:hypothetical protein
MADKIKETDLFIPIKTHFIDRDNEVYSEVLAGGGRADIVARQGNYITVIEMKTTLSLDLLEQANRWLRSAHYVYIAVPRTKDGSINRYAKKCCLQDGIGILQVDFRRKNKWGEPAEVIEVVKPKLLVKGKNHKKVVTAWDKRLTEAHKDTLPGGSAGGGYITPYKTTIEAVKRCLRFRKNGVSLNELVQLVQTHYSNPKQGLYNALTNFEDSWCDSYIQDGLKYFKIREGVKMEWTR